MEAAPTPEFNQQYAIHLKRLTLQVLRPKTIDAYARAVCDAGAWLDDASTT